MDCAGLPIASTRCGSVRWDGFKPRITRESDVERHQYYRRMGGEALLGGNGSAVQYHWQDGHHDV
jgi:hypothetical protein